MKTSLTPLLVAALAFTLAQAEPLQAGPVSILNDDNLDGWTYKDDKYWSIADGVLTVTNDNDKGDTLFTEKSDYTDFEITLDFKFGEGTIDSGVFLRDGKEQIQVGESGSLKKDMTALPYIPGKGYPIQVETALEVLKMEDWNTLKIRVEGNSYTTWLNGTEIMSYDSETIQPEGPIGIQVHSKRDMTMYYRNIAVEELK